MISNLAYLKLSDGYKLTVDSLARVFGAIAKCRSLGLCSINNLAVGVGAYMGAQCAFFKEANCYLLASNTFMMFYHIKPLGVCLH
jgi:hypothetical protein